MFKNHLLMYTNWDSESKVVKNRVIPFQNVQNSGDSFLMIINVYYNKKIYNIRHKDENLCNINATVGVNYISIISFHAR